jgi:hypothetical protein
VATALQDQQLAESRVFTPPAADSGGSLSGAGAQGYWKKPDGTIVWGAYTVNGMRSYTRKRFMPLFEYPQFTNDLNKRTGFDPMHDSYRLILERGGIKEFGLAQIVELGWHRKPHRVLQAQIQRLIDRGASEQEAMETVIPQLRGFVRVDVPCLLCPGKVLNSEDELARHEILHKEDVQTRRLSESISQAVTGGQAASTEALAPVLRMLADAITTISANQAETQANLANTNALIARLLADREPPSAKK